LRRAEKRKNARRKAKLAAAISQSEMGGRDCGEGRAGDHALAVVVNVTVAVAA